MPTHITVQSNDKPINIRVRVEPVLDVKVNVNATTTIWYKGNGVKVSHVLNSKKKKVIIYGKAGTAAIKLDEIDEVVALLNKIKFAAEVA